MPTAEQLARLAAIGRQSVAFVQNQSQIGTISTHHRAAINRIRAQARQSIVVVDGQIEGNVPAVPGSVAASTLSSSSIRVTCEDVPNENGYKWYRNTTNNSGTATLVGTTGMNVAAFTDSGLTASTTYYYWVKATNTIGDSAFSSSANTTTSAPVTPGDGTADQFLGTYLGHFRFNRNGLSPKMFNRDALIAPHPDGDKLYYAVSGSGIENLGASGGQRGYVTAITIPAIGTLSPSHDITQSPQAVAPTSGNWVEHTAAYADHRVAIGNIYTILLAKLGREPTAEEIQEEKWKNNRLGGLAYDSVSGKLWLNFGKHYHTGGPLESCVLELNPSTLAPIGTWYHPTSSGGLNELSGPNGRIVPLAGTALSSVGDLLVTPYWLSRSHGPRWGYMVLDSDNNEADIAPVVQHPASSPHPATSELCKHGGAIITSTHLLTALQNGVDGWYGGVSGFNSSGYQGGPRNITPDIWQTGKGYHAPPYQAEIWATPISEILEVYGGLRSEDNCNHTIVDITNRMIRKETQNFTVGGVGDPVELTSYQSQIDGQFCQMNGYYFLLEQKTELVNSTRQHVVHVWSGDN